MYKYLKIIFIFMLLMCLQKVILVEASTGTNISGGIIKQDITLTKEGSPYNLTGNIQIAYGTKFTVEPGVTIEGNGYSIGVFGDFIANGDSNSKITLNDVNVDQGGNNYTTPFLIHIENASIIHGSLYRPTGHSGYGSLILKDSRLFNLSNYLYIWHPTSDVYIERNVFMNSGGISVGAEVKVSIVNNVFFNYSNFAVKNWDSTENSETIVSYNSFLYPKEDKLGNLITYKDTLVLPSGYSSAKMTATNNYWGTTDESVIEKMIFDKNDDLNSASYINFKPYLQSPDPNTPNIDIVAPEKPIVNEITEKSEYITGNAEKFSVINVVNEKNDIVGKTQTDDNGEFRININTQNAGSKLFITATDDWLNKSEPTIVIVKDVTAPSVPSVNQVTDKSVFVTGTAEADSVITVKAGTNLLGTTLTTSDGNYTVSIPKQEAGTVLSVTATDNAGNVSESADVTVKDIESPIIVGATSKTININSIFNPKAGVSAKDNMDGDLTGVIKVTGTVNTKQKGIYTLTYTVTDKSGNVTTVTRKITVIDNVRPVILGGTAKIININSSFNPKTGVTAKDNMDGDLTSVMKITGSVNFKKKGTYTLTYTVVDKSGNLTTLTRKITVIDNVKPIISGATSKTIKVKSKFNPKTGVTAKDNVDGNLTKYIKISGMVNTKKKGIYTLKYSVKDKSGNVTTVTRKITVK